MSAKFPIIEKLGGRDAVYDAIRVSLNLRTRDAMRMWEQRRSIPGSAFSTLWRLAIERGIACNPDDFDPEERSA